MKFQFNTEGGFAGLKREFNGDSASFPKEIKSVFDKLISEKNKFLNLPVNTKARDIIKYVLKVENQSENLIFKFDDLNIPDEISSLIYYLSENAVIK